MTSNSERHLPLDLDVLSGVGRPWRVEVVAEVASTNVAVADRARAGEEAGLVLVAEEQTAGRGRLERTWEAPPRSALTFSILLRPDAEPADWTWLPLLTGYVVQTVLADRLPEVTLKWPNDVLVPGPDGERKICGILLERVSTDEGPAAVVGIGLNVNQSADELVPGGTSLAHELGEQFDRAALLKDLLVSFDALLPLWRDIPALRAAYSDGCATIGRVVDVHLPDGVVRTGEALGLDDHGSLVVALVETEDGGEGGAATLLVSAGDVIHVRNAP